VIVQNLLDGREARDQAGVVGLCTIGVEFQQLTARDEDRTARRSVTGVHTRTLSHQDALPGPSQHERTNDVLPL
jgi:hypothetical protein